VRISLYGLLVLVTVTACGESPSTPPSPVPVATPPLVITITQFSLDRQSVVSGEAAEGVVTLSSADPAGGTMVTLTSNRSEVTVPNQVAVPTGTLFVRFPITTGDVPGSTAIDAALTATLGGSTRSATMRVTPIPPTLIRLVVDRGTGYVELDKPAWPGGALVTLRVDDSVVRVQDTALIQEGKLTANLSYSAGIPSQDVRVTFTASYAGVSLNHTIVVRRPPFFPGPLSLSATP
jgi:hypothetical protein